MACGGSIAPLWVFACIAGLGCLANAERAPRAFLQGTNWPRSAAVHQASGDVVVVATPGNFSVAALSPGNDLRIIDDGKLVAVPTDVAVHGDTAYVVDQGREAIVAFSRSAAGSWQLWKRWPLKDLVPPCEETGVRYGMPESIAVGPSGDIYVGLTMQKMQRCLLHPLTRCCESAAGADASVMQLRGLEARAELREVFNGSAFFTYTYNGTTLPSTFHLRAVDVTDGGDILVAGYGDSGDYFGHSAWLWEKSTGAVRLLAGQQIGQEGHTGDGGDATKATLHLPWGITSLAAGSDVAYYISESGNSDVRAVRGGIISTVPGLPDLTNCRKIHRGRAPNSLLLTMEGLGENMGYVLEFVPGAPAVVLV